MPRLDASLSRATKEARRLVGDLLPMEDVPAGEYHMF
jgi:hypothetical protein